MIQEYRLRDALKTVKYAAQMATSTGKPWGVYRNFKTTLIAMPSAGSKKSPLEVCNP